MSSFNSGITAATSIENTHKFLIDNGINQKTATLEIIKNNLDGRYQKLGTVIYDNSSGATSGSDLTFISGHLYRVYTDNGSGVKYLVFDIITAGNSISKYFLLGTNQLLGLLSLVPISSQFSTAMFDSNAVPVTNTLKVYKIIDLGVAQ